MQTPAHIAISLFIWRKQPDWRCAAAVISGAVLPDATMFVFYGFQKLIGSSESDIWSLLYFQDHWQLIFDAFNSIPVFLAITMFCLWRKHPIGFLFSASALVHVLCDFPLHHDDAHRHFLPFTHWRFISPVSYWDPKHFGFVAATIEFLTAVVACFVIAFGKYAKSFRVAASVILVIYLLAIAAVVAYFLNS